ncbi:MAG: sulfotransferase domain-containing protein [Candidatus Algichlamydia australiensis]|nr:sulfotransferase domain-containing protein [Chlamydiales bacterium]
MKKLLLCCVLFAYAGLFSKNILLSVPRSGSHWLLYGVGFLCLEPFSNDFLYARGKNCNHSSNFANPFGLDIDESKPPFLVRTHRSSHVQKQRKTQNKLILIVRNPLESLVSRKKFHKSAQPNVINRENLDYYLNYLRVFDSWNKKNRLLVYYEDLIEEPQRVFEEILVFLGKPLDRMELFFQDYDYYRETAMNAYSNHFNYGAVSNGEVLYHSKKVKKKNASFVKEFLQDSEPEIYFDYLSRYFN